MFEKEKKKFLKWLLEAAQETREGEISKERKKEKKIHNDILIKTNNSERKQDNDRLLKTLQLKAEHRSFLLFAKYVNFGTFGQ